MRPRFGPDSNAAFLLSPPEGRVFQFVDFDLDPSSILLASVSRNALEMQVRRDPGGPFEERIEVGLGNRVVILALRGFERLSGEGMYRSRNSGAVYLARRDLGSYGYLIQYLPERVMTSEHAHGGKEETFWIISGHAVIGTSASYGGKKRWVAFEAGRCVVPALTYHQLATNKSSALNILKIVGPDPLSMYDYLRG